MPKAEKSGAGALEISGRRGRFGMMSCGGAAMGCVMGMGSGTGQGNGQDGGQNGMGMVW